jgi:hypothetical protein
MEIWKKIKGFENYEVSNLGEIRNFLTQKKSKLIYIKGRNLSVRLKYQYFHVGIIVARAFYETPPLSIITSVSYKDTCFFNNNIENLIPIIKSYDSINL